MWKKGVSGVEFKYKGKRYFFEFCWETGSKGPSKIRPVDEPENKANEVTIKDYKVWFWSSTVNVNGKQ